MEWTKATDQKPKDNEVVLVCVSHSIVLAEYDRDNFYRYADVSAMDRFISSYYTNVEYWMPLPALPK
jgi:hypothetical protein